MSPPLTIARPTSRREPSGFDAFLASLSPEERADEERFLASLPPEERAEHTRMLEDPFIRDIGKRMAEHVAAHGPPPAWSTAAFVEKLLSTYPPARVAGLAEERVRLYGGDADRELDDLDAGRHPVQRSWAASRCR
jgi:hypothetical protein